MTTLTIPTEEYGSECYPCSVGAGSERCECLDENRCYGCNEKIAWQYDVELDGEHYHRTCAEAATTDKAEDYAAAWDEIERDMEAACAEQETRDED